MEALRRCLMVLRKMVANGEFVKIFASFVAMFCRIQFVLVISKDSYKKNLRELLEVIIVKRKLYLH